MTSVTHRVNMTSLTSSEHDVTAVTDPAGQGEATGASGASEGRAH